MKYTKFILSISLFLLSLTVAAAPAYRGAMTVEDTDGRSRIVYGHGDEDFHYLTDEAGVAYRLVTIDGRSRLSRVQLDDYAALNRQKARRRGLPSRRVAAATEMVEGKSAVCSTPPRVLVVLAEFSDLKFEDSNTRSLYNDYFNSANYNYKGATGSVSRYFADQSYGQYRPEFEVVGPVALSNGFAYYGDNDEYGDDVRADLMVYEACSLADGKSDIDFSRFDADGDGYVDAVIVVYAGRGESDSPVTNAVWPQTGSLEMSEQVDELVLGGKTIDIFCCVPELNSKKSIAGIGTVCHEFSHVLGLPNLSTTNGDDYKTFGKWDVMDYGSFNNEGRTPAGYSAYERFFMGWVEPILLNEPLNGVLRELSASGDCAIVTQSGQHNLNGLSPDPREFFILENRQQTGWDEYLPGHGLMLTKVNFVRSKWEDDIVNNLQYNQCVDLIEADGKTPRYKADNVNNGYFGKAGDLFPAGATSKTFFSNHWQMDNVSEANGVVYFDFQGGVERCTVSFFVGSNGTCSVTELTESKKRAGVKLPAVTAKSGYTFLGWATRKNSSTADAGQAGDTFYPMSDCTLFALYRNDKRLDINYDLKGVEWNSGATAYAEKNKAFEITFTAKAGYLVPAPATCQVRVMLGSQLMPNYSFENDMVVVRFAAQEATDNVTIVIRNTREQKADGCEPYSHTFSQRLGVGEKQDIGGYDWDVAMTNDNTLDFSSSKGAIFGSGTYPVERLSLITDETMGCAVSEVRVTASTASNGDAALNVYLAGDPMDQTQYLDETMQTYSFVAAEPKSGRVEVLLTNTKKAIYIKSIAINFTYLDDVESAVTDLRGNVARVYGSASVLVAEGLRAGDVLSVYDLQGHCLTSVSAHAEMEILPLSAGVYVVMVENQSGKPIINKAVVY